MGFVSGLKKIGHAAAKVAPVAGTIAGGVGGFMVGGPAGAAAGAAAGGAIGGAVNSAANGSGPGVLTRAGQATGLLNPADQVHAADVLAPTNQRASDIYQKALDNATAAGSWAGPQPIRQSQVVTAPTINAQGIGRELVNAPTAGTAPTRGTAQTMGTAPTRGTAPTAANAVISGPAQGYQAALVNAPRDVNYAGVDTSVRADTIGPAAQAGPVGVQRATLGPASTVAPTTVGRTDISRTEANAARGDLVQSAKDIRSAPSAAGSLYDAALSKIGRQQRGIAAQARGSERGGARREAMLNIGERGMDAAAEKAGLSAQEEQAKRMGAASVLTNVRGEDVNVAKGSADLQQGANLAQAGITHSEAAQDSTQAQDINIHRADLSQQASNLQAQIDEQTALGNMQAVNQLKGQQAQIDLAARQTTVGAGVDQAKAAADVAAGNAGRTVAVDTGNAARTTDAAAAYTAAINARNEAEAQRQTGVVVGNTQRAVDVNEAAVQRAIAQQEAGLGRALTQDEAAVTRGQVQEQQNLDRGVQVATTDAANTMDAAKFTATAGNTAAIDNAGNVIKVNEGNVDRAQARDIAQGQQDIQGQQVRQSGEASGIAGATGGAQVGAQAAGTYIDAATGQQTRQDKSNESLVKTITTAGQSLLPLLPGQKPAATAAPAEDPTLLDAKRANADDEDSTSDERVKKDVRSISDAEVMDLVDKMRAVSFRYKPGVEDGGADRHAGVMAQDLERSPLGRDFVSQRPDGVKQVDYGNLAALIAATAARSAKKRGAQA